jgi:hypothetical protein
MKKMVIGKRGSHVGIVLSFVIFIVFLVFVLSVLQPKLNIQKSKQSMVEYLRKELIENFSGNLTTIFINATDPSSQCIRLDDFLINASVSSRLILQNKSSSTIDSRVIGNDLEINKVSISDFFFKVYASELLNESDNTEIIPCQLLEPGIGYFINLKKMESHIFESSVNATIENYESDYNRVKIAFNIPSNAEFGFVFRNSEGIISQPAFNISKNSNVYSDDVPILYVTEDGYIKPGYLTIVIW